jgi:molybdopterin/thiamine biosynthesis adenylyltransferase
LAQPELSDNLIEQFGRQILVPGIDEQGQLNLSKRKICIIGLGALGTVASQYLVRSGIGEVHLIDPDKIEESNLHRQINYTLEDVGAFKSEVSKNKLQRINDITKITSHQTTYKNYLKEHTNENFDLVFDCTDNHENKILSSQLSKNNKVAYVSISINSTEGIYFSQNYQIDSSVCFACLFPQTDINHRCLNSAMIGPVAGFVTSLACTKIIFALASDSNDLKNEISLIDLLTSDINKLQLSKINCPH